MQKLLAFGTVGLMSFQYVFASLEGDFMQALSSPTEWSKQKERLNKALDNKEINVDDLDLSEKTFEGYDFSGMNFENFNFIGCKFKNVNLEKANLINVGFWKAGFEEVKLGGAILSENLIIDEKKSSLLELVKRYSELKIEYKKEFELESKVLADLESSSEGSNTSNIDKYYKKRRKQEHNLYALNQIISLLKLDLSGKDLSGLDLSEINLTGANLTGANLQGVNLQSANLSNALLESVDLQKTKLISANLAGINLVGKDLSGLNLSEVDLENANLTGAKLQGANLRRASLVKANLTNVFLKDVKLLNANLGGVRLSESLVLSEDRDENFKLFKNAKGKEKVIFQNLISGGYNLFSGVSNDTIKDFNWKDFDFSYANLNEAQLEGIDLTGINLEGSNISWTNFSDALLVNANLKNTNLRETNFKKANLSGAQLTNANLYWTTFDESNLTDVNITETKGVEYIDFSKVRLSKDYVLPEKCSTQVLEKLHEECQDEKLKPILKYLASNVKIDSSYFEDRRQAPEEGSNSDGNTAVTETKVESGFSEEVSQEREE